MKNGLASRWFRETISSVLRQRKLPRLTGYDYTTPGAYFITICVHDRAGLLGEISAGQMILNRWGEIAANCWSDLPKHYPGCRLDAFVVMPNHVHGLVWIIKNNRPGNGLKPFPTESQKIHGIPEIIRGFKTYSSRQINITCDETQSFRWQKSYHDRIVRNDDELNRIRDYIEGNPGNWQDDANGPV